MYKHTIYLPKHDNDRSEQSYRYAETICGDLVDFLSTHFGGCTVTHGDGYYHMNGKVVVDNVWLIHVITSFSDIKPNITYFIDTIKNALMQESVLITTEDINAHFA